MRPHALPWLRRLAAGAGLAVLAAGITPVAASANTAGTDLVISEFYGNGGNTGANLNADFVELYNPTASPISLAGKSIQYRSATGTANGNAVALSGTVPAGKHFLIQVQAAGVNGSAIPTPDLVTSNLNAGGSNGLVYLANTTSALTLPTGSVVGNAQVIDLVGFGTANTFETLATGAGSATTSFSRSGADTDDNSKDFTVGAQTPTNSTAGTPSGPVVAAVGDKTFTVNEPITPFTVTATGGATPYTWSATGLPAGLSIAAATGEVSGTPTAIGTSSVTVAATDAAEATGQQTFSVTVSPAAGTITPIADIQGTGATTPLAGQAVTTRGVVTAAYPTGGLNGFYIQTPGADTPDASDAIFVYGGSGGFATYPAVGDSVEVTGQAAEFSGQTQINASAGTVTAVADLGAVTPKTTIPGTTCSLPGTDCELLPNLAPAREVMEGELLKPTSAFTVTDSYDGSPFWAGNSNSSGMFGEIGLAAETDVPLVTPTELYDAQDEAVLVAQRTAYNNARRIVLDDGSSLNYTSSANTGQAFPWLTSGHTVRVGAAVTFPEPVVFTESFNTWRLLPTTRVVGAPSSSQPQIQQTRADDVAPQEVGGDIKLATFNVLNYFPTTGEEYVTGGLGVCTYYNDREGNPITTNQCGSPSTSSGNGPRGAANAVNLQRQQDKIVAAINTSGADIVSLEELENSAKFGKDRDFAIGKLVEALNVGNAGKWAFVPSPTGADLPPLADEDVIRTGFIYQPAAVAPVGTSKILVGSAAFANAREPLAQAFKAVGSADADAFAVIVNHFKSKGSGTNDGTGQGNANPDRVAQANDLVTFANQFKSDRGISRVFLTGDFNSYTHEDPIQVLNAAGYTNLESTSDPSEETYNFDGMVGSLDHVLANDAALADVSGVDVWDINASESVYYEYSRFNYNLTNLYDATPFKSSDHNPEIVGINTTAAPTTTDVQIIGTNDYHGRLAAGPRLAAAVKAARAANPNTVFAAAGDLVGATTFESFIQHDKPTIDVMNEAGLDVSAVGNHEFDAGYDDLVDRIMKAYDPETNPEGGAQWKYLGANVKFKADDSPALDGTWIQDFGPVEVGFVGAVTEDLPSLVAAGGIADIKVTDIVEATNAAATDLKAEGADVVVLLVHEGAGSTSYASATTPGSAFGDIVNGVGADVDAIISGHTHLAYNHSVPVPAWVSEGRAVTERPVVSAGQYGENLNKLVFTLDNATGEVQAKTQEIVPFASFPTTGDAATQTIVSDANAKAAVLGAEPLGKIAAGFSRAKFVTGAENRGGESTLGNKVAEVQRWATDADIAFMNPGGLRADMMGTGTDYPRTVTYKNAADVQPFANTLMTMDLTGASIKKVLEQQWQRNASGQVPARPFLKLGLSDGFEYTYDPTRPEGDRITGMWLNGTKVSATDTFKVAANGFLASGTGDNFFAFAEATNKRDSGKVDLQAMVDYMDAFAPDSDPLAVDYAQRAVGVSGLAGDYTVGETVTVNLSSLAMTGAGDLQDSVVAVEFDGVPVGEFAVDNTANPAGDANSNDEAGKATVSFRVPPVDAGGSHDVVITGAATGTSVTVPVNVRAPVKEDATITTTVSPASVVVMKGRATVSVTVSKASGVPTGVALAILDGKVIGAGELVAGKTDITLAPFTSVGTKSVQVKYFGDETTKTASTTQSVTVVKAQPKLTVKAPKRVVKGTRAKIVVGVSAAGYTPRGTVTVLVNGKKVTKTLKAGRATVRIRLTRVGKSKVRVVYSGDSRTLGATVTRTVRVVRR